MGQGARQEKRLALILLVAAALAPAAGRADPIVTTPPPGKGVLATDDQERPTAALLLEVVGVAVAAADRLATLPELGPIERAAPQLLLARVGLWARAPRAPLAVLVRADASELLRLQGADWSAAPGAAIGQVLDDAAVHFTPRSWASVIAGRHKVPFSRFRHLDRALSSAGVVPFSVDRVAPDRRWGAAVHGDLGALGYAAGVYEDLDALAPRVTPGDPSVGGRALAAAHVEWTPRAPIGADHLATPCADPWFSTVRASAGAGVLVRWRGADLGVRTDASASAQLKWRRAATLAEVIVTFEDDDPRLGVAGEASLMPTDRVALFARGDYDPGAALWSAGAGASWMVTPDRRNRVTVHGWARRGKDRAPRDGLIVLLQASL